MEQTKTIAPEYHGHPNYLLVFIALVVLFGVSLAFGALPNHTLAITLIFILALAKAYLVAGFFYAPTLRKLGAYRAPWYSYTYGDYLFWISLSRHYDSAAYPRRALACKLLHLYRRPHAQVYQTPYLVFWYLWVLS